MLFCQTILTNHNTVFMKKKLPILCCILLSLCSVCSMAQTSNEWHIITNDSQYIPVADVAYLLFGDDETGFSIVMNDSQMVSGVSAIRFAQVTAEKPATRQETIGVSVFPNPVTTQLTLQGLREKSRVCILNINGNTVIDTVVETGNTNINVENLPSGMYLLQTQGTTVKFIKKYWCPLNHKQPCPTS